MLEKGKERDAASADCWRKRVRKREVAGGMQEESSWMELEKWKEWSDGGREVGTKADGNSSYSFPADFGYINPIHKYTFKPKAPKQLYLVTNIIGKGIKAVANSVGDCFQGKQTLSEHVQGQDRSNIGTQSL